MRSFIAALGASFLVACGSSAPKVGAVAPDVVTSPAGESWRQYSLDDGTFVLAETRLRAIVTIVPLDYRGSNVGAPVDLPMFAAEAPSDGRFCPLTYHYAVVASMIPPHEWAGEGRGAAFHAIDDETSGGVIVSLDDEGVGSVVCGRWRDAYDHEMRGLLKDLADKVQKR